MSKPATSILKTDHPLYSVPVRMFAGFCETQGEFPLAHRGNATGNPSILAIPGTGAFGKASGQPAEIRTDDPTFGPYRRFCYSAAYEVPGAGFSSMPASGSITFALTLRLHVAAFSGHLEYSQHMVAMCNGSGETMSGIAIVLDNNGTPSLAFYRAGPYFGTSGVYGQASIQPILPNLPLTMVDDEWYSVAINRSSQTTTFWMYRHSTGTLWNSIAGGGDSPLQFDANSTSVVFNPCPELISDEGAHNQVPLLADVYAAGVFGGTFTNTGFGYWLADPAGLSRGTANNLPGVLVPGQSALFADVNRVCFGSTSPLNYDATPTFELDASPSQGFAFDAGTVVPGVTEKDAELTTSEFLDLSPDNTPLFFAGKQSDSAESVVTFSGNATYGYPAAGLTNGSSRIGLFGDSHSSACGMQRYLIHEWAMRGYQVAIIPMAWIGSALYHPTNPALSWQPPDIQSGTWLLERALEMIATFKCNEIWSCLSANDPSMGATGNSPDVFEERYRNIIDVCRFADVDRMVLNVAPPRNNTMAKSKLLQSYFERYANLVDNEFVFAGDMVSHKQLSSWPNRWRPDYVHGNRLFYSTLARNQVSARLALGV